MWERTGPTNGYSGLTPSESVRTNAATEVGLELPQLCGSGLRRAPQSTTSSDTNADSHGWIRKGLERLSDFCCTNTYCPLPCSA